MHPIAESLALAAVRRTSDRRPPNDLHEILVEVDDLEPPDEPLPVGRQATAVEPEASALHDHDTVLAQDVEGLTAWTTEPGDELVDGWPTVAHEAQELPREKRIGNRVRHASLRWC